MKFTIKTRQTIYENLEEIKDLIVLLKDSSEIITDLDLSLNTFKPVVFKEISPIIKNMKNLKRVKFESIFDSLNYEEMCEVCAEISNILPPNLLVFELPSNALSCKFPSELGEFISRCSLNKINLYNCGLGEDGLIRLGEYLDKLENKNTLEELHVGKNRINILHSEFGKILNKFPNLSNLKICHNTIHQGMDLFLKELTDIKLEVLDISDNFIDEATELNNLINRSEIKELYLKDIKTEKMDDILENLILTQNNLELGEFPEKKDLILDVSQNDLEEDSTMELLIKLAETFNITKLIIYDNYFENIDKLKNIIEKDGGVVIDVDPLYADDTAEIIEKIEAL